MALEEMDVDDAKMKEDSIWVRNQKALAESLRALTETVELLTARVENLERAETDTALEVVQAAAQSQQDLVDAFLAGNNSGPTA